MYYSIMFDEFLKTPTDDQIAKVVQKLIRAMDEDRTHIMSLMDHLVELKGDVKTLGTKMDSLTSEVSDLKGTTEMGFNHLSEQMSEQTELLRQIATNTSKE